MNGGIYSLTHRQTEKERQIEKERTEKNRHRDRKRWTDRKRWINKKTDNIYHWDQFGFDPSSFP